MNNYLENDSSLTGQQSTCHELVLTALDLNTLRNVMRKNVLPLFKVEQFAMIRLKGDEPPRPLMLTGILTKNVPNGRQIMALLNQETLQPVSQRLEWIQQVVPLSFNNKLLGVWLLGKHSSGETDTAKRLAEINHIAKQVSLALVNIDHANDLRTLYMSEIEHQELDHRGMAVKLQTEVLNPLSMLKDAFDPMDTPPLVSKTYLSAMQNVRELINLLYPAMKPYSLYSGLVTLVETLNSLRMEEMQVFLNIPDTDVSYEPEIETNLYRIIQQACKNAIQHSRANAIHISGIIEPHLAEIVVSDDGVGFSNPDEIDLPTLLSYHHFGLASMFERAELIGAALTIDTAPNQGCRVLISWHPSLSDVFEEEQ